MNRKAQRIIDSAPEEYRDAFRQSIEATELLVKQWPLVTESIVAITHSGDPSERSGFHAKIIAEELALIAEDILHLQEDVWNLLICYENSIDKS